MPDSIEVIKGGVTWFDYRFTRGKYGLEVWIKVAPEVEAFVKGLGNGTTMPIEAFGRTWYSPNPAEPLMVYDLQDNPVGFRLSEVNEVFNLDRNGHVNLSMLRLVGTSSGAGVTIGLRGPISYKEVGSLKTAITESSRKLAKDYIVPIDVRLQISTQMG